MIKRGFDSCIVQWIMTMLDNRIVSAELGISTLTVKTTRGCPQGGVLSPLLWSLVVDDLLNKLTDDGFEVIGFADDLVILVRGKFDLTISERMQHALNLTSQWCRNEKLNVNAAKTVLIPFTRRRKLTLKTLKINGLDLQYSKHVKFLGVLLDEKLNWNIHLEQVVNKATNALWISRKTFGKHWGLKPKMIQWIYTAIIKPRITYAALVWWPKTKQTTTQKKLEKLQRLVCLSITGAMRSTPTKALNASLHIPPLYQFVQMEAAKSALRLRKIQSTVESSSIEHLKIISFIKINKNVFMTSDWMESTLNLDEPFKVIETNRNEWESGGPRVSPGSIIFYTDGSKMGNKTGAGITGPGVSVSIPMGQWTTVFLAEIYAILECASICLRRNYRLAKICIFSDSQAALNALKSPTCQSKLVWECRKLLKQLASKNQVHLYWVPGHRGIDGNEKADLLARNGSEGHFIGPEPFCGVSKSVLKMEFVKHEEKTIQLNWTKTQLLRQSREFITPSTQKSKKILNLNKKYLNIYIGLITGHCPSRYHLKKLGLCQIDICRFCDCETETSKHLICDCSALSARRRQILNRPILSPKEIWQENPSKVVDFILEIIPEWGIPQRQPMTVTLNGNVSS